MKKDDHIQVEFLVEPFVEGAPGPAVRAALDAFDGLNAELGPFASTAEGPVGKVASAIETMIRTSLAKGATSIRIQLAAPNVTLSPVGSLQNALNDMVRHAEQELETPAAEWNRQQKQQVVRMLEDQGAFLLRGAVDDIAEIMGVSRITIYNYINAL